MNYAISRTTTAAAAAAAAAENDAAPGMATREASNAWM